MQNTHARRTWTHGNGGQENATSMWEGLPSALNSWGGGRQKRISPIINAHPPIAENVGSNTFAYIDKY